MEADTIDSLLPSQPYREQMPAIGICIKLRDGLLKIRPHMLQDFVFHRYLGNELDNAGIDGRCED